MKNQLKIYLKTFILIFGTSLLLLNCEKEEIVQFENQQTFSKTYKVISLENIEKLKPVISNIKKVKPIKQDELTKDLSFLNSIENLNTDEISQYTNETGYSSYSFKFNYQEEGAINFENLQLLETTNGDYIAYILAYEPNPDWYYNNLNSDGTLNLDISTYKGELTKYSLEREVIWTTKNTGEVQAKAGGDYATVCTYSIPSCDQGNHDNDRGWDGCIYSDGSIGETCTTVYVGGGSDTSDGTGGSNTNNDDGPCNNVAGTPIVDDQPLSGTDGGCAPNNNNGTSNNNALLTFYQGLDATQQGFLSSNQAIYNQVGIYLSNNGNAPQAKDDVEFMIDTFVINDWVEKLKNALALGITSTAEVTHDIYNKISVIVQNNPRMLTIMNIGVDGLRVVAGQFTDTNTQTADWLDLFNMWLFELGSDPINFDGDDATTLSLKTQEGVNDARALALSKIQNNDFSPTSDGWTYGQGAFYDGMANGNIATSFLGSYTTSITVVQNTNGTFTLNFTVSNPSTWESATRLRIDNNADGTHDGIFDNTTRDNPNTINLGGNFDQNWNWSEIHP